MPESSSLYDYGQPISSKAPFFSAWNQTQVNFPETPCCLHQLIEAQVARAPERIAVSAEGEALTYQELNLLANQLAHFLKKQGIGPENLVGVALERSLTMIIALLGVLKSGAAYVPIDPRTPSERFSQIVSEANITLLLTSDAFHNNFSLPNLQSICLDRDRHLFACEAQLNLPCLVIPTNLAYVIYTSGSTGRPKGAMNTHQAICNRLLWMHYRYALHPSDSVIQKTPFSFDISLWEFFAPLISGARLVMARPEGHKDALYLVNLIQQEAITVIHFVPSMLQIFLQVPEVGKCTTLRRAICSGEALTPELQKRWFQHFSVEMLNLYGPTEAAIEVTSWRCQDSAQCQSVPIGYPIANTQLYILDEQLHPVPIGAIGELHIGGIQVGRGYLKRADLTAEKFIPDPFASEAGARLYKTGDLACYRVDGAIEYHGRLDYQIKLRGFRIELGDIEANLILHPAIQKVAVLLREDIPGDQRLVAYLIADSQTPPSQKELRRFLRPLLPDYMVPNTFVFLDAMPVNSHGKLDRRSLPEPQLSRAISQMPYTPPATTIERTLAQLWSHYLGIEQIGSQDHFFELGGHSLTAMQLLAVLREEFQVDLSLATLFETPILADLAHTISTHNRSSVPSIFPHLPGERPSRCPLSFTQGRFWFFQQWQPDSPAYHVAAAYRLRGPIRPEFLARAIQEITKRHETLRTIFPSGNGEPWQQITSKMEIPLELLDVSQLSEAEQVSTALHLLQEAGKQRFSLEDGPLLRATLVHKNDQEHFLLFVFHHIINDGWSINLFVQELCTFYQAYSGGWTITLPPHSVHYADFTLWQRSMGLKPVLEKQLAFWQQWLDGIPHYLDLPLDTPRPEKQTFRGRRFSFSLSPSLVTSLQKLSQQYEATLFMTLLAAWGTLLFRYTHQERFLVGIPVANRMHRETQQILGAFVNTLPLPLYFSAGLDFVTFLQQVRKTALTAYAHQDLPFDMLVNALQAERNLSYAPLCQTMFVLQDDYLSDLQLPGCSVEPLPLDFDTALFDLLLEVMPQGEQFVLTLQYSTDVFAEATIQRMAQNLIHLFASIVQEPDAPVHALPLLSEMERSFLFDAQRTMEDNTYANMCILEIIMQKACETPDVLAIVHDDQQYTYAELNEYAERLARHLHTFGVGPEIAVGVYMTRSFEIIASFLGVLKAGGVYVPMDPHYPAERLGYIIADAQIGIVLTQKHLLQNLPKTPARYMLVEQLQADYVKMAVTSAVKSACASLDQLAYIVYTSGSTGKPKGVDISHRSLLNTLCWYLHTYQMSAQDRISQAISPGFDPIGLEVWPALMAGASLHIADDETRLAPERFYAWLLQQRITHCIAVPPGLADGIIAQPWKETASLRYLMTGGDTLQDFPRADLPFAFDNQYGPAECTILVTMARLSTDRKEQAHPPIGRPIWNTQIYILDRYLQPVPAGVSGELYIGGENLARGYHERPDVTAQCFLPNPFSTRPGARLYRTGDLARFLPDGQIAFLGRVDHQIKIRGFRIEPGEIAANLARHEAIQEVALLAREDLPGQRYLIAYIVLKQGYKPTRRELRQFLKRTLPDYMLPSAFVYVERLPQNTNGKLDVQALPPPAPADSEIIEAGTSPRTAQEQTLATIWCDLLGLQSVGIHDNFFDLGGHSLLISQVITRLYTLTSKELPLRTLFEAPTIAELAERLEHTPISAQTTPTSIDEITAQTLLEDVASLSEAEIDQLLNSLAAEKGHAQYE